MFLFKLIVDLPCLHSGALKGVFLILPSNLCLRRKGSFSILTDSVTHFIVRYCVNKFVRMYVCLFLFLSQPSVLRSTLNLANFRSLQRKHPIKLVFTLRICNIKPLTSTVTDSPVPYTILSLSHEFDRRSNLTIYSLFKKYGTGILSCVQLIAAYKVSDRKSCYQCLLRDHFNNHLCKHLLIFRPMATPPAGYAFLSTIALLEQRREGDAQRGALFTPVTFDALLPCRNDCGNSPITCNVRYMQHMGEHIEEGIYDVFLKVILKLRSKKGCRVTLRICRSLPMKVTFTCQAEHEKTTNSIFSAKSFRCGVHSRLHIFINTVCQMRPLNLRNNYDLSQSFLPSTVVAMGVVSMVHADENCFSVSLRQNIGADASVGTLTIHCVCTSDSFILPTVNELVVFGGELLTVHDVDPVFCVNRFRCIVNTHPQPVILTPTRYQ